jgi:delta-aminolevulinic acid dehydratase/porphobilinogen synthase
VFDNGNEQSISSMPQEAVHQVCSLDMVKHEINLLSIPSFPLFTIHKMSPEAGRSKALAHQGVSKHAEAPP